MFDTGLGNFAVNAVEYKSEVGVHPSKSLTVGKSQSLQDEQYEERLRIAERLVQILREAGYSLCESDPADDPALHREH